MDKKTALAFKRLIQEAVRTELQAIFGAPAPQQQYAPQYNPYQPQAYAPQPVYRQPVTENYRHPAQVDIRTQIRDKFQAEYGMPSMAPIDNPINNIPIEAVPPHKQGFIAEQIQAGNPLADMLAETAIQMKPGEEANFRL